MHENFIHPHPRSTLLKCWLVKAGRWEHFPVCFEVALQPCAASFATACDGKWKSAALLFPCECVACLTGKLQPGLEFGGSSYVDGLAQTPAASFQSNQERAAKTLEKACSTGDCYGLFQVELEEH